MNDPTDNPNDSLDHAMRTILSGPDNEAPSLRPDERAQMLSELLPSRLPSKKFTFFCVLLGIIMPLGTVVFESIWHACAEMFFNPIPTVGHAILCACVPLVNLFLYLHLRGTVRIPAAVRSAMVGLSFGISLFYIITFIRIMPIVGMGLVFIVIGIGLLALLPLSPHFGALYTWLLSRKINRLDGTPARTPLAAGFGIGLAAILAFAAIHYQRVATFEEVTYQDTLPSEEQIQELGSVVSQSWMKQSIASPPDRIPGINKRNWGHHRHSQQLHTVYYKMYGSSEQSFYNAPSHLQGNDWIGRVRKDLKLATSDMSGWVDGEAGLGYVEWTQEFVNYRNEQAEGRQHIELPPGGVVSRVTLWVNGEPREAAFDTVAKTRAAYEYIVQRKRDPVLVNALKRDHIQIECFPVPPQTNNVPGRMKFRVGISFPLPADSMESTRFQLPRMVKRNFLLADEFAHSLELNSQHAIEGLEQVGVMIHKGSFKAKDATDHGNHPRWRWGTMEPEERRVLTIPRDAGDRPAVATDPVTGGPVTTRLVARSESEARRIAIVVDRNAPLKRHAKKIAALEKKLSANVEFRWFLEDDRPLEPASFQGGGDAVPVLLEATNWLQADPHGTLIWLHGGQPLEMAKVGGLANVLQTKGLTIQGIQVIDEPNFIADRLTHDSLLIHHDGTLGNAFEAALKANRGAHLEWVRERATDLANLPETQTLPELAKLLAHEEIITSLAGPMPDHDALSKKAVAYKLVTPVSAAIVLESREEYLQHGLKPPEDELEAGVADASAPGQKKGLPKFGSTVPEPSTLLMLLFGSGLLVGMRRFREWWAVRTFQP